MCLHSSPCVSQHCLLLHKEGVEHQSLAQLLHELTRKLQGEQADDAHVASTRRPLHVSVQVVRLSALLTPVLPQA